jgi:hypothetical protein
VSNQVEVRAQIINGAPLKYNGNRSTRKDRRAACVAAGHDDRSDPNTEAIPLKPSAMVRRRFTHRLAGLALVANPEARVFVQRHGTPGKRTGERSRVTRRPRRHSASAGGSKGIGRVRGVAALVAGATARDRADSRSEAAQRKKRTKDTDNFLVTK